MNLHGLTQLSNISGFRMESPLSLGYGRLPTATSQASLELLMGVLQKPLSLDSRWRPLNELLSKNRPARRKRCALGRVSAQREHRDDSNLAKREWNQGEDGANLLLVRRLCWPRHS